MKQKKNSGNRGFSMADVVIAIVILSIFAGVVGTLLYRIVVYNNLIRIGAIATQYTVQIAEDIDEMKYDDVVNGIESRYSLEDLFTPEITVTSYGEGDNTKEDIIKIITIKMTYQYLEEEQSFEIRKLKIKEI